MVATTPSLLSTTDLESDEDDEVGQVQGKDLTAGGGSGGDLEGCLQQGSTFCS